MLQNLKGFLSVSGLFRRKKNGLPLVQVSVFPQGESQERIADMSRILVLYYSSYGHVETMAHNIAEGVRAAEIGRAHV